MNRRKKPKALRVQPGAALEEFKAFLGPLAAEYNDAQLQQLHYEMHAMADLLLDLYLWKPSAFHGKPSPV